MVQAPTVVNGTALHDTSTQKKVTNLTTINNISFYKKKPCIFKKKYRQQNIISISALTCVAESSQRLILGQLQ